MKRVVLLFYCLFMLTGCASDPKELDAGMQLRCELLKASSCSFTAQITASYDDRICRFSVDCQSDPDGDISYQVLEPDSISGIAGNLSGEGGQITFDDVALTFPLMGDNMPSPVSAPWIMLNALRSGFLTSACTEAGKIRLSLDDRYEDEPLQLDIWLNEQVKPDCADILHDGRRILTVEVSNFQIS